MRVPLLAACLLARSAAPAFPDDATKTCDPPARPGGNAEQNICCKGERELLLIILPLGGRGLDRSLVQTAKDLWRPYGVQIGTRYGEAHFESEEEWQYHPEGAAPGESRVDPNPLYRVCMRAAGRIGPHLREMRDYRAVPVVFMSYEAGTGMSAGHSGLTIHDLHQTCEAPIREALPADMAGTAQASIVPAEVILVNVAESPTAETLAHEVGHILGLKDIYGQSYGNVMEQSGHPRTFFTRHQMEAACGRQLRQPGLVY